MAFFPDNVDCFPANVLAFILNSLAVISSWSTMEGMGRCKENYSH